MHSYILRDRRHPQSQPPLLTHNHPAPGTRRHTAIRSCTVSHNRLPLTVRDTVCLAHSQHRTPSPVPVSHGYSSLCTPSQRGPVPVSCHCHPSQALPTGLLGLLPPHPSRGRGADLGSAELPCDRARVPSWSTREGSVSTWLPLPSYSAFLKARAACPTVTA